jgi:hypothetical protein
MLVAGPAAPVSLAVEAATYGGCGMSSLRTLVKSNRLARASLFLAQNAIHQLRSRPPSLASGSGTRYQLAAMIRVKDEARFLPEWLAHHVGLGVEHVVVYDNNSSDGIHEVIGPFVREGLATYVAWPAVPASPSSHLDFITRFGPSCEWAAFFDADEFLVESVPGALASALRTAGDAPAIAVNWRFCGSAGHETIPTGLITERFDRAAPTLNHHVKVIARPAAFESYRNSHNFYYRRGRLARTPEGRRVFGSFATVFDRTSLVLNHYVYRSREDYERKAGAGHGFVDASGAQEQARRAERAAAEFHRHNEVAAQVPEATRRATADLLQRLGYPEGLYRSRPTGAPATVASPNDPGTSLR